MQFHITAQRLINAIKIHMKFFHFALPGFVSVLFSAMFVELLISKDATIRFSVTFL